MRSPARHSCRAGDLLFTERGYVEDYPQLYGALLPIFCSNKLREDAVRLRRVTRDRHIAAGSLRHTRAPALDAVDALVFNRSVDPETGESLPIPPYNPGLRDLVEGKRQWTEFLGEQHAKEGFRGWNERGYLPHRDEPGLTQLVTFRLVDSFPRELRSEWEGLLLIEDNSKRRTALECYLDKGRGQCFLRRPEIAKIVEDAILTVLVMN